MRPFIMHPGGRRALRYAAPRRVVAILATGLATAAMVGAPALPRWAETLPETRLGDAGRAAAAAWERAMTALGPARAFPATRRALRGLVALRFGAEEP